MTLELRTGLYIVWALIIIGYFFVALWSLMEKYGDKRKANKIESSALFKNFAIVTVGVAICFFIDMTMMDDTIYPLFPDFIPKGLVQIMLLPVVFTIGAQLMGGTKPESIQRGNRTAKSKSKKKARRKR